MSAEAPLNGNARLHIASLAEEALKAHYRRRAEILTELRKIAREVADLETIRQAAGVETVSVGDERESSTQETKS